MSNEINCPKDYKTTIDTDSIINKILSITGLPSNFICEEYDVPNAMAVMISGEKTEKRKIYFNSNFLIEANTLTNSDWATISILAHEVGHHLSGHTLAKTGRPDMEIEADKFSGFVLAKMGATLNETLLAIKQFGSENDSDTHPSKTRRIDSITDGWNEAQPLITEKRTGYLNREDFYIMNVVAVASEELANKERNKLLQKGYPADYLWIPNYSNSLGTAELYTVFIGPYFDLAQCEIAVENYRKKVNPNVFGLLVSDTKEKLRIDGLGKIYRTGEKDSLNYKKTK